MSIIFIANPGWQKRKENDGLEEAVRTEGGSSKWLKFRGEIRYWRL